MKTNTGDLDFLILGAGRGGTSLLAGLLDGHPELEVSFERGSAKLMGKNILRRWRWPWWRLERDIVGNRIEAFLRSCRARSARFPDTLWGNKITTEQLAELKDHNLAHPDRPVDVVDRFLGQALAGVKVLFILRDGRSCVESKVRRTGQEPALACQRWRFSVEVYRYLQGRPGSHSIRFEDLVERPESVLRSVCRFLDVEFVPEMMKKGTRSEKMRPEYRLGRIEPSKAEPPELPPEVLALIADDLRACGYI